jgi:DNA-binding NarL/FixJ family response regulator
MNNQVKTILLVEDESIIAMSIAAVLKKNGFIVSIVHNGEQAISTFRDDPAIDMVLMDIDLGKGMDGAETAQIILSEKELPVVFISSHTEPAIVEKTCGITSYGYVVKNSGETVLLASLRTAFTLFKAHRELQAANETLRESETRYRFLTEKMNDIIWTMDLSLKTTYVSPSVYKVLGFTPEERMAQDPRDQLTPPRTNWQAGSCPGS